MKSNFQFWKRIKNSQYPNFLWITCPPQTSTSPYDYASHQFSFSGESWCTLPCGGRSKLFIIYLVSPTLPAHGSVPLLGAHTDEGRVLQEAGHHGFSIFKAFSRHWWLPGNGQIVHMHFKYQKRSDMKFLFLRRSLGFGLLFLLLCL